MATTSETETKTDIDTHTAEPQHFTVTDADEGARLDRWLAEQEPGHSRSRFKELVKAGHVTVNGAICTDPSAKLPAGSAVMFIPPPIESPVPRPEAIDLDILFEDGHIIVVNKPPGLVVHPAQGHWTGTLVNALLHHCGDSLSGIGGVARPGIVHRLDKDTSGIVIAAKTETAHRRLSETFAAHDLHRAYLAIARGVPTPLSGTVAAPIKRGGMERKRMVLAHPGDGTAKHAVTHYKVLKRFFPPAGDAAGGVLSLLRCVLETGRTHQIRVHLGDALNTPVLGDPVYARGQTELRGVPEAVHALVKGFDRQALHAEKLRLCHPITGEQLAFCAAPPSDFQNLLHCLDARV
jgi:23S rRNA pseudouridine1911/1915/1917 synthase